MNSSSASDGLKDERGAVGAVGAGVGVGVGADKTDGGQLEVSFQNFSRRRSQRRLLLPFPAFLHTRTTRSKPGCRAREKRGSCKAFWSFQKTENAGFLLIWLEEPRQA